MFIPISICNVNYKIITKVIDNRIKMTLQLLISLEKFGFVEGRKIMDGIILVHEVIQSLKKTKILGMMLKLDIAKAYDKLNWKCIQETSKYFSFGKERIRWVTSFITLALFSILINDYPYGLVKPYQDIIQGYPLSHFLFVLMVEGLGIKAMRKIRNCED